MLSQRYINGSVQDCSNSITNTLDLLQSCIKPSICSSWMHTHDTNMLHTISNIFPKNNTLESKKVLHKLFIECYKPCKNSPCELCFYHVCMPKLCSMPNASLFECIRSNMQVVFNPDVSCSKSMDNTTKYVLVSGNTWIMHQNSSEKKLCFKAEKYMKLIFTRTTTDTKKRTPRMV